MLIGDIVQSEVFKKLPRFIREHNVFYADQGQKIRKIFPTIGLPNGGVQKAIKLGEQELDLVFSSDGLEGLWDLATMSMRGVISCMHWDNWERHAKHLVGSIVDPYCGIIYLTDNTDTEYGKTIVKRSLVRYIIHEDKPALFLEKIYYKNGNVDPKRYHINTEPDPEPIINLFKSFLDKSGLPLVTYKNLDRNYTYNPNYARLGMSRVKYATHIPYPTIYNKLSFEYYSMSDYQLPMSEISKDLEAVKKFTQDLN